MYLVLRDAISSIIQGERQISKATFLPTHSASIFGFFYAVISGPGSPSIPHGFQTLSTVHCKPVDVGACCCSACSKLKLTLEIVSRSQLHLT